MVPANAPALVQLPPGANTHFPLPLTLLHIRGFATEPDKDPIFEQLVPIDVEGFWANVDAGFEDVGDIELTETTHFNFPDTF